MRAIIIRHPVWSGGFSMARFAEMIETGMRQRRHEVRVWTAKAFFGRIRVRNASVRKWLGYIDQYVIFQIRLALAVIRESKDSVFIVTDQALGIWVHAIAGRPHVVHCHDLLALRSALGEFPENHVSFTGKVYQRWILRGFSRADTFISVSKATRRDLHRVLGRTPRVSEVVLNGLHFPFAPMPWEARVSALAELERSFDGKASFLLHVGSDNWYKNRVGVLEIYKAYCECTRKPLELWMVGAPLSAEHRALIGDIANGGRVITVSNASDPQICACYSHAAALLFPSLEEGFGWPVAEAMSCGCPVVTTEREPMTEVGGNAACYIPRRPNDTPANEAWARSSAEAVMALLNENPASREQRRREGLEQAQRFGSALAVQRYLDVYERVEKEGR